MRPFTYTAPTTVAEAIDALVTSGPGTKFLAGGTNLYDLMRLEVETPRALVDIHRLAELNAIDTTGPTQLVFGAGARMSDVADDVIVKSDYPALSESLWRAASQQLRNMATLGGNLLQRTVALRYTAGPQAALSELDTLAGTLDGYHLYHATRAEVLRGLGRPDEARTADGRALQLTTNPAEQVLLQQRLNWAT